MTLDSLFYPKSICLIGSSRIRERGNLVSPEIFRNIMNNLRTFYKGKFHAIDISKSTSFPEANLYIVSLPEEEIFAHLKDFKCKFCIILPGNFTQKTLLTKRMGEMGIRFLGPNSVAGIINTDNKLNTTFEKGLMPNKANFSIVSQSGGVGASVLDFSITTGISKLVWLGNGWDIDFDELLEYLGNDKQTKAIGIYIEGIKDGESFLETVKKIKKPIVALKGGLTKESAERAFTHTSSLAGSPEVYSSAFKQLGIIEVSSINQLFETTYFLSEGKEMRGDKVAIVSNVGGQSILAADYITKTKLKLVKFSENTQNAIQKKFIEIHPINPLDLIADANRERFEFCLKHVLKDKNVDAVLVINMLKSCTLKPEETKFIAKIIKKSKKPILDCVPAYEDWNKVKDVMSKEGIYVFNSMDNAVKVLEGMYEYFMFKKKK